jgi:hypothetical protein
VTSGQKIVHKSCAKIKGSGVLNWTNRQIEINLQKIPNTKTEETKKQKKEIPRIYNFCLDANKRNSDLDVNNGFPGSQGRLFKILKMLIFSSTNPLDTCIIYFCRKISYTSKN